MSVLSVSTRSRGVHQERHTHQGQSKYKSQVSRFTCTHIAEKDARSKGNCHARAIDKFHTKVAPHFTTKRKSTTPEAHTQKNDVHAAPRQEGGTVPLVWVALTYPQLLQVMRPKMLATTNHLKDDESKARDNVSPGIW